MNADKHRGHQRSSVIKTFFFLKAKLRKTGFVNIFSGPSALRVQNPFFIRVYWYPFVVLSFREKAGEACAAPAFRFRLRRLIRT
jgi:hypothetical protein